MEQLGMSPLAINDELDLIDSLHSMHINMESNLPGPIPSSVL